MYANLCIVQVSTNFGNRTDKCWKLNQYLCRSIIVSLCDPHLFQPSNVEINFDHFRIGKISESHLGSLLWKTTTYAYRTPVQLKFHVLLFLKQSFLWNHSFALLTYHLRLLNFRQVVICISISRHTKHPPKPLPCQPPPRPWPPVQTCGGDALECHCCDRMPSFGDVVRCRGAHLSTRTPPPTSSMSRL